MCFSGTVSWTRTRSGGRDGAAGLLAGSGGDGAEAARLCASMAQAAATAWGFCFGSDDVDYLHLDFFRRGRYLRCCAKAAADESGFLY